MTIAHLKGELLQVREEPLPGLRPVSPEATLWLMSWFGSAGESLGRRR